MEDLLTSATSEEVQNLGTRIAALPVGSFEQHGRFHPLITDTVIACTIAQRIADDYSLFLLPPVTFSCSHEHSDYAGTVSISASTLIAVIRDIQSSLRASAVDRLVLVNGHGGNYVLQNVVQEANASGSQMALFPGRADWDAARADAGMQTNSHEDMHAGELETSILLHATPHLLRPGYDSADWRADDRPFLLMSGMREYTESGVIGFPSLGTAEKGERALASLSGSFKSYMQRLSA
ncbi:creatininase family protein [Nocardia sp. CC227C]|uniref:creatininase family protein n=1 Tax=Nocardia sp. CC227C TaxID=3044562 RepID=UPI00278C4403|nr:creatininase family protein [Nocardia sp. CC227C]